MIVAEGGVIVESCELSDMILTNDSSLNDDTAGDTSIETANEISLTVSSTPFTYTQIPPIWALI